MNFKIEFSKYTTSMNLDRHFLRISTFALGWRVSLSIERLGFTSTTNGKSQSVPRDQVSHLLVVYFSFFLHIN